MKRELLLWVSCVMGGALLAGPSAHAQASGTASGGAHPVAAQDATVPSDQEIDLLRKDLRSQKKQIIAANLALTDKEAEKFWPVYDQYTADLVKINDTKYQLIKDYAQNYNKITDEQAESYVRGLVGVDKATSDLRLTYWPKFRSIASAKNTALFFQLDRRISTMIDLQLASQIPLIQP